MYDRIFQMAKSKGVQQKDLAKMLGYKTGILTEWKSGRLKPSAEAIVKLADFFEVSVDYLLGRTDSKEPVNAPGRKKEPTMRLIENKEDGVFMEKKLGAYYDKKAVLEELKICLAGLFERKKIVKEVPVSTPSRHVEPNARATYREDVKYKPIYTKPVAEKVNAFLENAENIGRDAFDGILRVLATDGKGCADSDYPSPNTLRIIVMMSQRYRGKVKEFCDMLVDADKIWIESQKIAKKETG